MTMKRGLVLEGGAMRGLFTAGVLDVLMERGVRFDGMIGVSAGACFGCNYKSGQVGRAIRYNRRFARDPRYCSWVSLLKTGDLFGGDFCYRELPTALDVFDAAAFAANPMEFHVVATDCATGNAVYRRLDRADESAFTWIRASASMPIVHGYRKFPKKSIGLVKPLLRRYPAIYAALKSRYVWYNAALEYIDSRVAAGKAVLISPKEPLDISRVCHDPERMQRVYDVGRKSGEEFDVSTLEGELT